MDIHHMQYRTIRKSMAIIILILFSILCFTAAPNLNDNIRSAVVIAGVTLGMIAILILLILLIWPNFFE